MVYSKNGYEEMSGLGSTGKMLSNMVGKILRTGRDGTGAQVSDQEKLAKLDQVVTFVEEHEGQDQAIMTFLESIGKGLQKTGNFVNDNAGGALKDDEIKNTAGGTIAPA